MLFTSAAAFITALIASVLIILAMIILGFIIGRRYNRQYWYNIINKMETERYISEKDVRKQALKEGYWNCLYEHQDYKAIHDLRKGYRDQFVRQEQDKQDLVNQLTQAEAQLNKCGCNDADYILP